MQKSSSDDGSIGGKLNLFVNPNIIEALMQVEAVCCDFLRLIYSRLNLQISNFESIFVLFALSVPACACKDS